MLDKKITPIADCPDCWNLRFVALDSSIFCLMTIWNIAKRIKGEWSGFTGSPPFSDSILIIRIFNLFFRLYICIYIYFFLNYLLIYIFKIFFNNFTHFYFIINIGRVFIYVQLTKVHIILKK